MQSSALRAFDRLCGEVAEEWAHCRLLLRRAIRLLSGRRAVRENHRTAGWIRGRERPTHSAAWWKFNMLLDFQRFHTLLGISYQFQHLQLNFF